MDFLRRIDAIYEVERAKYPESDDSFGCFIDIEPINQETTHSFIIKKREKSMLLIVDGNQRVHMSDLQIVNCIRYMRPSDRNWFLQQFIELYSGKSRKISFKINGDIFEGCGIELFPQKKELYIFSDTTITYNDFIFLLNFIFSKDQCWEELAELPDFRKRTIIKYITLIDYYGNRNSKSRKYLKALGYPVNSKFPIDNNQTRELFKEIKGFDISLYR